MKSDKYNFLEKEKRRKEKLVAKVQGEIEQKSFEEENSGVQAQCHFISWSLSKKRMRGRKYDSFIVYLSEELPEDLINWVIQNAFRKVKAEN